MGRNVYLKMKTLEVARGIFLDRFDWRQIAVAEAVPVAQAIGRVLAEPAAAAISAPSYHGAAMDGVAVRAERTYGASDTCPLELAVGPEVVFINTGEPLPPGTDAVIMIEQVQRLPGPPDDPIRPDQIRPDQIRPDQIRPDSIRIEAAAFPWQHVRRVGEEAIATEMLFPRHHRLGPTCVGALMSAGVRSVSVVRCPRVLVIPTGPELVSPGDAAEGAAGPGAIIEFNSTVLGGLIEAHGGTWLRHEPVDDDPRRIAAAVQAALPDRADMVLIIGGSSAGSKDFTRQAVERVGQVLVHGITVMPGKPTLLGAVAERPVVGIPGYPVSAVVAFDELVAPALAQQLGVDAVLRTTATATPIRTIASKLGMEELVRVRIGRVGARWVATPLARGAGAVLSFARADGIVRVPANLEGLHALQPVAAELLRPIETIEAALVAVGSHDICLDVLADLLRAGGLGATLSSSHVGSLGGLMALRAGACHLAGVHLLDPSDGGYNLSFVRRYLPDLPVRLVHLVDREQGLIVRRGAAIGGLEDLTGPGVRFINRQGGSGTRVLLDHELARRSIDPASIQGYERVEFTHMAVAVAVASGAADAGLGIRAAARALELDFVPVATERFELAIPERFFDDPRIACLRALITSAGFRQRVARLGGYDTRRSGEVRSALE